jgi:membrane protease YdiL (CAAX protease family)
MKGLFQNLNGISQIVVLVAIAFFCYLAGSILFAFWILAQHGGITNVAQAMELMTSSPDILRQNLFVSSLFTFLLPALIAATLFSADYRSYLHLTERFTTNSAFWTVASMIVVLPLLNFTADLNSRLTLPDSMKMIEDFMRAMEEASAELVKKVIDSDRIGVYILNVLIIAVLAGISEEFFFRGVLQRIFSKMLINKHIVIWSVAIIFSAIHFQFFGFLPRMLLGAYFGYLLLFTRSIWIPVIAHFTNNFISVTGMWLSRSYPEETGLLDTAGTSDNWWLAVASAALFVFCIFRIKRLSVVSSE